jgi:D-amino-acid dehydrogenase
VSSFGIIGAGVVGTATALQLQTEGHTVTLFDPRPPGTACSYGNSGGIGIGLVAPIAMPGIGRQAPRLLLDPNEPLFIEPRHLLRKASWFWRFWQSSFPGKVDHIAAQRAALNHKVIETLTPLVERANACSLLKHRGMTFVFAGQDLPAGAKARFELGRRHGVVAEQVTARSLREALPDLADDIGTAVHVPGNRHCTNPGELVARFAAAIVAGGGRLERQSVRRVQPGDQLSIVTESGTHSFDRIVIAAGVWSRELAASLGTRVLLEAERGYHLMLPHAGIRIEVPTTLADRNIVLTPMDEGLRITGIAEFAEPDSPANETRARNLLQQARRYFPALDGTGARIWVGPRPSTPDSLPVIGRSPRHRNILFAFGHGQSGLAHASVTARLVADIAAERAPLIDISAFSPERFSRR